MVKTTPVVFNFVSQTLRVVLRDGEPWFVAADVCDALTIGNNRDATARLDDDEKGVGLIDTPSGQQEMTVINESGLYSLILGSRKPEAKKFKKWVTAEVLPAIRKTGRYEVGAGETAPPAKLGEVGEWITRQHHQNAARYLCRSSQSVAIALRAGIESRFGMPASDLSVGLLPELLDTLEQFGDDCYRLWSVCQQLETLLLTQWKQQHEALPPAVKQLMAQVLVPHGPGTVPENIRANVRAMLPAPMH